MTRYLVLGAGMQGTAAVHDLVERGDATSLVWIDADAARLSSAAERIRTLSAAALARRGFEGLHPRVADAGDPRALAAAFDGAEVCLNALPYRFALAATRAALDAGVHLLDLGGNTKIAREQLALHRAHRAADRLVVLPDCGLMPGMGNLFTAYAVQRLGDLDRVAVRCGGLPERPEPPLDYMLLFSVEGLLNEYFGRADVLRDGRVASVETFTGLEELDVPGVGRLEAFITSGGLSTTPWTFEGRIRELDYKTLRYPGHHAKFRLLLELGLLDETELAVGGTRVAPRAVLGALLERVLHRPGARDLAVIVCDAVARDGRRVRLSLLDRFDPATGFTAMERTTAYSATACAHLVARGAVAPGPAPLEEAIDPSAYLAALAERGLVVDVVEEGAARA